MTKRDLLTTTLAAAVLTLPLAACAAPSGIVADCGPGPETLSAAGTLLLFASAEHGADALRMAMQALATQASPGCLST